MNNILQITVASFLLGGVCMAADQKLEVIGKDGSKTSVIGHCYNAVASDQLFTAK